MDFGEVVEHLALCMRLIALENTPAVQHVAVCTLYSCYSWNLLDVITRWTFHAQ
jgi:hypothetical protein